MGRLSWLVAALGVLASLTAPTAEARKLFELVPVRPGAYYGRQLAHSGGDGCGKASRKRRGRKERGWSKGQMTYYWGSEPDVGFGSGPVGGCNNQLEAYKSVAVPQRHWDELKGRTVAIEGTCDDCVVDDMCAGPQCVDLDLYVGWENSDGKDGRKDVRFKFKDRVEGHPCVERD